MNTWLAQLIGFIGLLLFLLSYQVKTNRRLYLVQTLGCLVFILQYYMLGAYSACPALAICIVRNLLLQRYNEWEWVRWKGWVVIIIVATTIATLFTWDGWTSLLPLAAMSSFTIAFWTNNALNIRKANLFVANPAWIIYDVIFQSWAGLLNELITIASILISIWRFGWKNMGDPESGFGD